MQVALSFILLFSIAGLDQSYAREFHSSSNRKTLLIHCGTPGTIITIALGLCALTNYEFVSRKIIKIEPSFTIILILAAISLLNHINTFAMLTLRMQEKGKSYTLANTIPKLLQVILFLLLPIIALDNRFDAYVAIYLFCLVCSLLYAFSQGITEVVQSKSNIHWDWPFLKERLAYSLPMMGSSLAYWALTSIGTIFIQHYSTLAELGKFALISSVAGIAAVIQSMVTVAWTPIAYKWHAEGKSIDYYEKATSAVTFILALTFLVASALSPMVALLLPSKYSDVSHLLPAALLPALLYTLSEVSAIGIALSRRTLFNMLSTIAALATNITLSLFLVKIFGMKGAIISNAISYYIFFVLRTIFSNSVSTPQPLNRMLTVTLLGVVTAVASALQLIPSNILNIGHFIFALTLFAIYKNELLFICRQVLQPSHQAKSKRP